MDLRDFIVTPILILLVYAVAWYIRPRLSDAVTWRYFLPALTVKIIGALAVGFIYQFYYDGGDTFNYHTYGSRIVWEALIDEPMKGARLLFAPLDYGDIGLYNYQSRIIFAHDAPSYMIVRIAAFFDLFTFSTYSATAVLFAVASFLGSWLLFLAFYDLYPSQHRGIGLAIFFIPSVFFWGSGVLKDSVVLACVGALTYAVYRLFIAKTGGLSVGVLMVVSALLIFLIRKYVLICFAPAVLLWIYMENLMRIRSVAWRLLIVPIGLGLLVASSYYAVVKIGEDDPRYAIERLAQTSMITAYDIGFYSGKDAGSRYALGELDGTFAGMLSLAPQAVNVTLFRPYLWETKNVLMLISALESFLLLAFTLWIVIRNHVHLFQKLLDPTVVFCIVFSITFAFAVGISTFNFGTLVRYKIPMLPFYTVALIFLFGYRNSERKLSELERVE